MSVKSLYFQTTWNYFEVSVLCLIATPSKTISIFLVKLSKFVKLHIFIIAKCNHMQLSRTHSLIESPTRIK